jgi:hypothetical protein
MGGAAKTPPGPAGRGPFGPEDKFVLPDGNYPHERREKNSSASPLHLLLTMSNRIHLDNMNSSWVWNPGRTYQPGDACSDDIYGAALNAPLILGDAQKGIVAAVVSLLVVLSCIS